jgi:hypothetical protein
MIAKIFAARSEVPGESISQDKMRGYAQRENEGAVASALIPGIKSWVETGQEPQAGQTIGDLMNLFNPDALAAKAGGLGAAGIGGMLRFAKKEYPNAFLHRTEQSPEAIRFLRAVLDSGKTTEIPASVITPSYTSTFRSNQPGNAGVVLNVNDPSQLKGLGARDMWSVYKELKKEGPVLTNEERAILEGLTDPIERKEFLESLGSRNPREWTWRKNNAGRLTDADLQGEDPLSILFGKQEEMFRKRPQWKTSYGRSSPYQHHNEALFQLRGPEDIAGISLSPGFKISDIAQEAIDLARHYGLPVFDLPQPQTFVDQLGGIMRNGPFGNALRDEWVRSPFGPAGTGVMTGKPQFQVKAPSWMWGK